MIFLGGFQWLVERLFRLVGVDKHYAFENSIAIAAAIVPGVLVGLIGGLFVLGISVGLMRWLGDFDTKDPTYHTYALWHFIVSDTIGYLLVLRWFWRQRDEPPEGLPD